MKRGYLILLLFLLIIPVVSAEISVNGPARNKYNLGDKVSISGYIIQSEAFSGLFIMDLVCNSNLRSLVKTIHFGANEKKTFSEDLFLLTYMDGDCTVRVSLEDYVGNVVEKADSNSFLITKELEGRFVIDESRIQLGKDIVMKGDVFKLSGEDVNGLAIIYLKQNDTNRLIDTVEVKGGKVDYTYKTITNPPGRYYVDILVNDVYGNQMLFKDATNFLLVNEIYVFARTDKSHVLPGGILNVFGEAKTIIQEKVGGAKVKIRLNDSEYETELDESKFSYDINLPEGINTGRHKIYVDVEDILGNKGSTDTSVYVDAIPTLLKNELNNISFKPEEYIEIRPLLYDQANELIIEDVSLEIISPEGKTVFSDVVKTSQILDFQLPKFSLPGSWTIKTYATGLSAEDKIIVEEVSGIEASLDNQTLYIQNIGNVVYKKPIEISLKGDEQDKNIIKKTTLNPAESIIIDLGKEVSAGEYDIRVNDQLFRDVAVMGRSQGSYDLLYWICGILLALLLLLLFIRKKRRKRGKKKRVVEIEKEEPRVEDTKKPIREFRETILRQIERREKKNRFKPDKRRRITEEIIIEAKKIPKEKEKEIFDFSSEPEPEEKKDDRKESGGLFGMFD